MNCIQYEINKRKDFSFTLLSKKLAASTISFFNPTFQVVTQATKVTFTKQEYAVNNYVVIISVHLNDEDK